MTPEKTRSKREAKPKRNIYTYIYIYIYIHTHAGFGGLAFGVCLDTPNAKPVIQTPWSRFYSFLFRRTILWSYWQSERARDFVQVPYI